MSVDDRDFPGSGSNARRVDELPVEAASAVVQSLLDPSLGVVNSRKLWGGSISRVVEWRTDGTPRLIVAKLNRAEHLDAFRREFDSLRFYRSETRLPVPKPLAVTGDLPGFEGAALLMEKVEAVNLTQAKLDSKGRVHFQIALAEHLGQLHRHTRETFGPATHPAGKPNWLDVFQPMFEQEFISVRDQLSTRTRQIIDRLLERFDRWFHNVSQPTLIHGDLWANNILVDDAKPYQPEVKAFIDPMASYSDPEYELAYLRVFKTAGQPFFERYADFHDLSDGFEQRCRVYWLNTMLRHVRTYGERYLITVDNLAREIQGMQ